MFIWMFFIIGLTISMILFYYIAPGEPQIVVIHAYLILLVSLGILYRIYRRTKARRLEKLLEEMNRLRLRVAELEAKLSGETTVDLIEEVSKNL